MTENEDWTASVHKITTPAQAKDKLKLEVRGVEFVFDSVVIKEGVFQFAYDNTLNVRVDRDEMPEGVYEWLGEHTDGFGNADAH